MSTFLDLLKSNKAKILRIAEKYGASNIFVFGSVARKEATASSDIDLLIDLEPSRSLLDQIGFQQELEDLLGIPVDVVETTTLHEMIRDQVLRDAVLL
jgi:predicted nucleotidyltransferase